jgi:hypothetical protein
VISITRHTANPLRAHADAALAVCAHDRTPQVAQLLYRSAMHACSISCSCCSATPIRIASSSLR